MSHDLRERETLCHIRMEHAIDEVLGIRAHRAPALLREGHPGGGLEDTTRSSLNPLRGIERRRSREHRIEAHSGRPYIDGHRIRPITKCFRCREGDGAHGTHSWGWGTELEIGESDLVWRGWVRCHEEHILELDVTMDEARIVDLAKPRQDA
jgi:hypothetical protein